MTDTNKIEHLSGCFQSLDDKSLKYLEDKKTQIEYLKGETVIKQGAFAPHVLFINKGLVKLYLQTGKDKLINLSLARQGDFLGFSSIFNNNYQYSAISITHSTICMLEKEALKKILLENPDFAMQITSRNCKNENRYLEIIRNVTYNQMRGKLASTLLYLTSDEFIADDVFQRLTRRDIADFASITVESTVKFLKEFESDGLISLEGKSIFVKDIDRLREMEIKG